MKHYEKILVCIDEPDRDGQMLDYTGAICRLAETKELHLLHVASPKTGSAATENEDSEAREKEITAGTLQSLGTKYFKGHGKEKLICEVVTGSPLVEILRYAFAKEVDLIVMGRENTRHEAEHYAVLPRRVTRKATCSVLVLPEGTPTKADKILVPVRNSPCSANAVTIACPIAGAIDGTVCCLNVFPVGSGHSRVGSSLEEHVAVLYRHAAHECARLLADVDTGGVKVDSKCVPDLYSQPVSVILNEIEKESADLVVIGARGRTGAAGVLLGKVTEGLIRESPVPVLAVKKKGECIGILQALLILAG